MADPVQCLMTIRNKNELKEKRNQIGEWKKCGREEKKATRPEVLRLDGNSTERNCAYEMRGAAVVTDMRLP